MLGSIPVNFGSGQNHGIEGVWDLSKEGILASTESDILVKQESCCQKNLDETLQDVTWQKNQQSIDDNFGRKFL